MLPDIRDLVGSELCDKMVALWKWRKPCRQRNLVVSFLEVEN